MKKTIQKLVLRRETLKLLLEVDLARAVGGQETNCPFPTRRLVSGCPEVQGPDGDPGADAG